MPYFISFDKFYTSGSLSLGRTTSLILSLFATIIFYFIPSVLNKWPFKVIYPVIATPSLTFVSRESDTNAETIVNESVEPSFLKPPSGAWT